MIETDLYPFFNQKAVLVLGADKKVKDCSPRFLESFGLIKVPAGTHIDSLFDMQGKDVFTHHLAWQPFRCIYRTFNKLCGGYLTGGEDGYHLIFMDEQSSFEPAGHNSAEHFNVLFSNMQDGVALATLIFDQDELEDYTIEYANKRYETLLAVRQNDVAGHLASQLFDGHPPFMTEIAQTLKKGKPEQFEQYIESTGRHFRLSLLPWSDNRFVMVLSDLSHSAHMQMLQKALNEAANYMSYANDTAEIFDAAAGVLRKNGFECMLLLLDEDHTITDNYFSFGQAPRVYRDKNVTALSESFTKAALGRRSVFLDSFDIAPDVLEQSGFNPGIKGIAAPLFVSDTFYGIFVLISAELKDYEVAPVTVFTNLMAVMVERSMLIKQLKTHVSELEQSKKAYQETAERLKMTSYASHIGFWEFDLKKGFVYIDDTTCRIHGIHDAADGTLQNWMEIIHPSDQKNAQAALIRSMRTGRDFTAEFRIVRGDGEIRYVRSVGIHKNKKGGSPRWAGMVWDITDRKMVEKAFRDSEHQFRRIFNLMPIGLWMFDKDGHVLKSNPAGKRIWGGELAEAQDWERFELYDYASGEALTDWSLFKTVRTGETVRDEVIELDTPHGKKIILNDTAPVVDENGNCQAVVMINRDITENERAKAALKAEKELMSTTLKSIGEGVVVTDGEGRITIVNTAFNELSGWTQEACQGQLFHDVIQTFMKTGGEAVNLIEETLRSGAIVSRSSGLVMVCRNGVHKPIAHTVSPIRSTHGHIIGTVLVIRDMTGEDRKQKKIDFLLYHDALTGVYNRRYCDQILKKIDIKENLPISVISCDVNGLKLTNDAFGHAAGDKLLMRMASVMLKVCRPSDMVVRLGGDEFLILMPNTDQQEAKKACQEIKALAAKSRMYAMEYSISVGYETKTGVSQSLSAVINKAEAYMYRSKSYESPDMRRSSIETILTTLHQKNLRERLHCSKVSEICTTIASAMGLSEREISEAGIIGFMHDIGKIAIDRSILEKRDRLTEEEWVDIKRHPEVGFRILSASNDTAYIAKSVLAHHERFDGSGYPNGLKGDSIPVYARILSVADAFEAMTNERPYRLTKSLDQALKEIADHRGTQFDPDIASVFLNIAHN